MTNSNGVATQTRSGGSWTVDIETGEAVLTDPPSARPEPPSPAAEPQAETPKKKVK